MRLIKTFAAAVAAMTVNHGANAQVAPVKLDDLLYEFESSGLISERIAFLPGNDFLLIRTSTQKDGKTVPAYDVVREGVYSFGEGACNVGAAKGNLYLAYGSNRCCFTVSKIGTTVLVDQIVQPGIFHNSLCGSRTLKRAGAPKKASR